MGGERMVFSQIPGDVLGEKVGPVTRRRVVAGMLAIVASSAMIFVALNIDMNGTVHTESLPASGPTASSGTILHTYEKLGIISKNEARKRMLDDLTISTRRLATRLAINTTDVVAEGNGTIVEANGTIIVGGESLGSSLSAAAADAAGPPGTKSLILMMGGSVTDFGPEQIAALKTGVEAKLGVPITGNITISAGSVVAGVPIPGNADEKKVDALVKDANQGAFQPVPGFPVSGCTMQSDAAANGEHWGPVKYWVIIGVGLAVMLLAFVQQASGQ